MADQSHEFDVYAAPYIPQALKSINLYPARLVPCKPAPWIDFEKYVQSYAGSSFLQARPAAPLPVIEQDPPKSQTITPETYRPWFLAALHEEISALANECERQSLYEVTLTQTPYDVQYSMYRLVVPGLREAFLPIEVGDIVHVRQLQYDQTGKLVPFSGFQTPAGLVPGYADVQHDAVVWAVDRLQETLFLRIDSFGNASMKVNATFDLQASRLGTLSESTERASAALQKSTSWLRSMLFPAIDHGVMQSTLNTSSVGLQLFDDQLNYEQQRAISTVIKGKYGSVPYIILGPPGTGKTKTVVELALQLLHKDAECRLLLCAPSDPAADILTKRLSKYMMPKELLRMNSPSRSFQEVPQAILAYCYSAERSFTLPPYVEMMQKRLVICTARNAEILHCTRLTNSDIHGFQKAMHSVWSPRGLQTEPQLHWSGLIIDEAAQATEPEALLPLLAVAPSAQQEEASMSPIVVMVGDQNQLGPRTAHKAGTLQKSLFERLLSRPLYTNHPLSRSKQTGGHIPRLTKAMLPIIRPPFTDLIRNYRSHPAILAIPSSLFYGDTLEPCASNLTHLLASNLFPNKSLPILFRENSAPDEIERDGGGWYNISEANTAITYAETFLLHDLLKPQEICIMSPFRAQVKLLRQKARKSKQVGMAAVNIGPLEAFQGLESPLVIICTTRTRDRFIDQDVARGLGVIHEAKRFNVALTRAMYGLIVIGNPDVLGGDENWAAFLAFCKRNGAWEGECNWHTPHSEKIKVSRLEKQFQIRRLLDEDGSGRGIRRLGIGKDLDEAAYEAGVAAEEAVLDLEEQESEGYIRSPSESRPESR